LVGERAAVDGVRDGALRVLPGLVHPVGHGGEAVMDEPPGKVFL
jgi:hypothetical protein